MRLLAAMLVAAALLAAAGTAAGATPRVHAYEQGYATYFRVSAADAPALAALCERDLEACGAMLVGDGPQFASDCDTPGVVVAGRIRRAAARARPGWGVVTRTENGGYPFTCRFAAAPPPPPDLCPRGRISRGELAALGPFERAIALAGRFFCVGPGSAG
jgi:hypothetical protein